MRARQVRSYRLGRGSAALAALLVGVIPLSGGAPARAVQQRESVSYEISVDPTDQTVCLGSTAYVGVAITRTLTVSGLPQPVVGRLDGGELLADNHSPDLVRLVNTRARVPRGGQFAIFAIEAIGIGTATLDVSAVTTGDEGLINHDATGIVGQVFRVNVVQCWEAYTSGLGRVWEDKYICDLERPFLLSGVWPGLVGSLPLFFMPTDAAHGRFVMASTLDDTWLISGSGTYDVVFRIGATVEEGNITVTGTGVMTTQGITLPVNPLISEVAIRPISDPDQCLGLELGP